MFRAVRRGVESMTLSGEGWPGACRATRVVVIGSGGPLRAEVLERLEVGLREPLLLVGDRVRLLLAVEVLDDGVGRRVGLVDRRLRRVAPQLAGRHQGVAAGRAVAARDDEGLRLADSRVDAELVGRLDDARRLVVGHAVGALDPALAAV